MRKQAKPCIDMGKQTRPLMLPFIGWVRDRDVVKHVSPIYQSPSGNHNFTYILDDKRESPFYTGRQEGTRIHSGPNIHTEPEKIDAFHQQYDELIRLLSN